MYISVRVTKVDFIILPFGNVDYIELNSNKISIVLLCRLNVTHRYKRIGGIM